LKELKLRDMACVSVGHRASEEWGIRWLAQRIREEWEGVDVDVVLEQEDDDVEKSHSGGKIGIRGSGAR